MQRAIFRAGAAIALCIAALALPAAASQQPRLIDQSGHAFTFDQLRGQPLVVTFIAATCTQACPLLNAQFAQLQAKLDAQHAQARLLTVTLDPDHDTPAVMRKLAQRFGADPRRWIVASGSPRDVRWVLHVFGVRTGDDHTTFVYLFDKNGVLRERLLASTDLDHTIYARLQQAAR